MAKLYGAKAVLGMRLVRPLFARNDWVDRHSQQKHETCWLLSVSLSFAMVIVRFPDAAAQQKALGFLIGRFSGHSRATGEMAVPDEALAPMAREGFTFTVEGL